MFRTKLTKLVLCLSIFVFTSANVFAATEPTTVTVWFYSTSAAVNEFAKQFSAQFNAKNPDIKLEFQLMAWDQINTGLIVAAASGVGPDISYFSANLIPGRIVQGFTLPLNKYLDAWPDKRDFIPDLLFAVTDAQGQVHALPFAMWGIFDLYNTDMFMAGGVSLPTDWDSLLQATRKLTTWNSDGTVHTYGYAAPHTVQQAVYSLHLAMEQLGKGMVSFGDTRVEINNEFGATALNFLRELRQTGMPDKSTGASSLN